MISRIVLPVVILAAAAAGALALVKTKPEGEPVTTQEKEWLVTVARVVRGGYRPTLVLYGRVETPRTARLTAPITADVVEVHVLEGERVKAGQLLASLDDREAKLLLRQREAELAEIDAQIEIENQHHSNDRDALARELKVLELAGRAVKRAEDLARTHVGSRAQLDAARQDEEQRSMAVDARRTAILGHPSRLAQLEARRAKVAALKDRAQLDLDRTRVRAPFAGPVSAVQVAVGDRVQPGTPLLQLFDSEALELRAQIPARYVPSVRRALANAESVSAAAVVEGQAVEAVLQRLGAQVGRGSGGVDALFGIKRGAHNLPLGLTVELTVQLGIERDVIALPPQAIYGAKHVFRVEGDRMRRLTVERVGEMRTDGETLMLLRSAELNAGDAVVSTQLPNAIDGLKITVAAKPAT
ncbi:MAG: biotin/lipoyl-binding protein [Gammaproteobacteria bacterium]|nr:biotin/lipoyl-binding protein [Gammaproteobacteria bacterium]